MDLSTELQEAKEAALVAGDVILEVYKEDFKTEYKEDNTPVTKADHLANQLIVHKLRAAFPSDAILSEEASDDGIRMLNQRCWIIDPLDGTKEFIKKNGEFTVNIALVHEKKPVLGVVYIPVKKELYFAVKGFGAYYEKNGVQQKISVSKRVDNIRAACSRSHTSDKLMELLREKGIGEYIYAGSALKGCMIASGKAEIYYRFGLTSEWDTAALQCIVEEAGGIFRQMDDTEMTYNRIDTVNRKGFYILNRIENKLQV